MKSVGIVLSLLLCAGIAAAKEVKVRTAWIRHFPKTSLGIMPDNLGNIGTNQCTFEVHATTLSLSNNIVRAQTEGKIPDPVVFASLKAKLMTAQKHHLSGNHAKEHLLIQSLIAEVIKVRGKQIEAVFADRLIAWSRDLIAMGN